MSSMDKFLLWERASRDTIDFKKIYVDMAGGDVLAGLALSEIVYWYLPTKDGGSKLRVEHQGKYWIAVRRYEWYERARITPDQSDRVIGILIGRELIEKGRFKYWNEPTVHIRLIEDRFLALWNEYAAKPFVNPYLPEVKRPGYKKPISPNGENGRSRQTAKTNSPNGENLVLAADRKPLTESTTETPTETLELADASASAMKPESGNGSIVKNPTGFAALAAFEKGKGEVDFSHYPEDVRETIREIWNLWKVVPPARPGKKGGQYALWINEARELREACGEFGLEAIRAYHTDWQDLPREEKYMPGRPGMLTYFVTAKAAELRRRAAGKPAVETFDEFAAMYEELYGEKATQRDYELYCENKGVRV